MSNDIKIMEQITVNVNRDKEFLRMDITGV